MNDYKELIVLSRKAASAWENGDMFYQAGSLVNSLCDAIEDLTAERDANLCAQQTPTKLDRNQWGGCPYCTFSMVETDYFGGIKYEWNRGQSLREWDDSIHIDDKCGGDYCCLIFYDEDHGETEVGIKYCPICGKPLTEEAWAELVRKIGGINGN